MIASWILALSVVLQFAAAAAALRLVRIPRRHWPWALIAAAVTLMGLRRGVTLWRILFESGAHPDLLAESIALVISMLMVVGVCAVVPHVEQLVRAREGAEVSERRYRTLVENAPEAIVAFDLDTGHFTEANQNAVELFGIGREALLRTGPAELSPEFQPCGRASTELSAVYLERASAGEKVAFEWTHQGASGEEIPCEVRLVRLPSSSGRLMRGSITDLSALRRLEREVQRAQKSSGLEVMAGGIAHDFNNLLVGILGNANLALLDLPASAPVRPLVESVQTGALRAAELAQSMLAFAGKSRSAFEPLDVSALVEEMVHLVEASISKKVKLTISLAAGLSPVAADATQLRQVLMNLILNASDAIGDVPGRIRVSTGSEETDGGPRAAWSPFETLPRGRYASISVSDTGCGMDRSTLMRIFDPFFTTKFTGRGLGLAAVLGIVRGHRGAIEVESERGFGTSFKLLLPFTEQPLAVARAGSGPSPAEWRDVGTVLVVDDEPAVIDLCTRALERCGLTVLTAADGGAGLEVYRAHREVIRAVVLDLTMPVMKGDEVFQEIARLDPRARVVLSSGYEEEEVERGLRGLRPAAFLKKPYTAEQLVQCVRAALADAGVRKPTSTPTRP